MSEQDTEPEEDTAGGWRSTAARLDAIERHINSLHFDQPRHNERLLLRLLQNGLAGAGIVCVGGVGAWYIGLAPDLQPMEFVGDVATAMFFIFASVSLLMTVLGWVLDHLSGDPNWEENQRIPDPDGSEDY